MNPADIAIGAVRAVLFIVTIFTGGCAMQQQTQADPQHGTQAAGEEFTNDQTPADGIQIIRRVKGATDLFEPMADDIRAIYYPMPGDLPGFGI